MALEEPILNMIAIVEPKAKRKYKIKKEREKDAGFEELATLRKAAIKDELHKN
jgi:neutral trehalase